MADGQVDPLLAAVELAQQQVGLHGLGIARQDKPGHFLGLPRVAAIAEKRRQQQGEAGRVGKARDGFAQGRLSGSGVLAGQGQLVAHVVKLRQGAVNAGIAENGDLAFGAVQVTGVDGLPGLQQKVHRADAVFGIGAAFRPRRRAAGRQITEGAQAVLVLAGLPRPQRRLAGTHCFFQVAVQIAGQPLGQHVLFKVEVVLFQRVGRQVVQLRAGKRDVLERAAHESREGSPAHLFHAVQAFKVKGGNRLGRVFISAQQRGDAPALDTRGPGQAVQLQQGGQDIDEPDGLCHDPAAAKEPWLMEDERHAQRFLVAEHAVAAFAVLAEALAMIAGDHHQRVLQQAAAFEVAQHAADGLVHVGDLAAVGIVGEALTKGCRRLVGVVGIVEMDPAEERGGGSALQPAGELVINPRRP